MDRTENGGKGGKERGWWGQDGGREGGGREGRGEGGEKRGRPQK